MIREILCFSRSTFDFFPLSRAFIVPCSSIPDWSPWKPSSPHSPLVQSLGLTHWGPVDHCIIWASLLYLRPWSHSSNVAWVPNSQKRLSPEKKCIVFMCPGLSVLQIAVAVTTEGCMLILVCEKTQIWGSLLGKSSFYPKAFAVCISCFYVTWGFLNCILYGPLLRLAYSSKPVCRQGEVSSPFLKGTPLCRAPKWWQGQRNWKHRSSWEDLCLVYNVPLQSSPGRRHWSRRVACTVCRSKGVHVDCAKLLRLPFVAWGRRKAQTRSPAVEAATLKKALSCFLGNWCVECSSRLE